MTIPLPFQVKDSDVQANFDEIAQKFPISAINLIPRVVYGRVLLTGAVASVGSAGSGDWTVTRTALGACTVTFTRAFHAEPAVDITAVTAGVNLVDLAAAPTTTAFTTSAFVTNTGAGVDVSFCFIAQGS